MKIYVQDNGVFGSIVVVANSMAEATETINGIPYIYSKNEIEEYEITTDFCHINLGDL